MLAELLYFVSIALFGLVILAAAQLPTGILLVLSLCPVFVALVLGGMLWIVAVQEFSLPVSIGSLVVPLVGALALRRLSDRALLVVVCAAVVLGMVCARIAIGIADFG